MLNLRSAQWHHFSLSTAFGDTPSPLSPINKRTMSDEWDVKICCMGAGYVGGPTMAVIAKQCPKVRSIQNRLLFLCQDICISRQFIWGNKWEGKFGKQFT